jgi:hypothetical protein
MPISINKELIPLYGIEEVARATGVMKANLRVWERRYGFPEPNRGDNGERKYSSTDLVRLKLVKQLLKLGFRASKVICLGVEELTLLHSKARAKVLVSQENQSADLPIFVDLIKERSTSRFSSRLAKELLIRGLKNFVINVAAPLSRIVNHGRVSDHFTVLEAYFFSETLLAVMRSAINEAIQSSLLIEAMPRVLLAAAPSDRANLELPFVEALYALEGRHCTSLDFATPLREVVTIGKSLEVCLIIVSFSNKQSPRSIIENVKKLQSEFGDKLRILVDSSCAASVGRKLGFDRFYALENIVDVVSETK